MNGTASVATTGLDGALITVTGSVSGTGISLDVNGTTDTAGTGADFATALTTVQVGRRTTAVQHAFITVQSFDVRAI